MASRPIFVVAGVGNASGTGGASARVFSNAGYRVALIARGSDNLKKLAGELTAAGGDAVAFPVANYSYQEVQTVFGAIRKHWPDGEIRAALWNAAHGTWKPFLDITEEEVDESLEINVKSAFAFSREAILSFKDLSLNDNGKRGTLIFTGATASARGNTTTSVFAAGKFGLRALSQSLAKEFGKQNIHVTHAIIDGAIATDRQKERRDPEWFANADVRLDPESIAKSYLYLAGQDRSAWTWELDLRPAHEKW
ncbi:NAD-P-binding protein [Artomyces pyxidatus]|uniref:NAD-P-binding protein n=1 Tax=Artomyces pyxidatus TaxID=48021 RepID=A0ACB8T9Y7_9AGAM|nr:NAD-P-binding protein [Artomyces pyxidatus]